MLSAFFTGILLHIVNRHDDNVFVINGFFLNIVVIGFWNFGIIRCGKTTLCQMFGAVLGKKLHIVNCHLHTESADFLGGLRPVRHRSHVQYFCHSG